MATIKDVAERTGLTVSTVSRVINNRGYISATTRERVFQAMRDLDYQPNAIAQALVKKYTNIIGVILPSLRHPFFTKILYYIEKYASRNGMKIMVCNSKRDDDKEEEYIQMLKGNKVAGIILCTRNSHLDDLVKELPIVTIERVSSSDIPSVDCDNYQGGKLATEELIASACKNISIINGSKDINLPANDRATAFFDILKEHHMKGYEYAVDESIFEEMDYTEVIEKVFAEHPDTDGIFATSDIIAAQIIRWCSKHNKRIPEDVKLVGYDDTNIATLINPSLTTIHQPLEEMCSMAVDILMRKVKGETAPVSIVMPVSLIKRETT